MSELDLGMFKAYDIRTKAELLDDQLVYRLMHAVARYFRDDAKVKSVVVSRDARISAPTLMEVALEVFPHYGLDVLVNPLQASTCQFYFTCSQHLSSGGMMVTASHNPGNYIGLKLLSSGMQPIAMDCGPEGGLTKIKEYYQEGYCYPSNTIGKVHIVNESERFIDYSMKLAGVKQDDLKGLKVCTEFLSGSNGFDVASALDRAGAEVALRHLVPDGRFPSGDPNPIIEKSIAPTRAFIKQGSFDLGFCFDGDGDRMDLMDATGEQIVPGFNMSVLVPYLLDLFYPAHQAGLFGSNPWNPQFYADVKAIPTALIAIAKAGIGVHIIRNGHSFIKAKLKDHFSEQFLASEEESAHYYMNFPVDPKDWRKGVVATENTLFYTLLTCRAWMEHPERYQQAKKLQQSLYREREWPLYFNQAPSKMENIMQDVEDAMRKQGAHIIKTMDDGSDLDATLMRFGLPQTIDAHADLSGAWCQVAQRISRSEDAMTRWEVASDSKEKCEAMNNLIKEIADKYVKAGYAHY